MEFIVDPIVHMWFGLSLVVVATLSFMRERIPLEVTSIIVLALLLLFGQIFPLPDKDGQNLIGASELLSGFSNPSLIAVMALLVMGQGMIHTDALGLITGFFKIGSAKMASISIAIFLVLVCVLSGFMNDTPLVVICIPLIQAMVRKVGLSESRVLIPLSYAAILGGITTLIGSSTNLLVSSVVTELGHPEIGIFDFTIPAAMIAGVGLVYVIFIMPFFLPDRSSMAADMTGTQKEFVAEIDVARESKLIGIECVNGKFAPLGDITVKLIQRGGQIILPPFENYRIEQGDVLIVAATRETLTEMLAKFPGYLLSEERAERLDGSADELPAQKEVHVLAEMMITPTSRMIDMSLDNANFERQFGVLILGIQRRAKVVRKRLGRVRLEAGDVLLMAGKRKLIDAMRDSSDFIVLSGSKRDLPVTHKAPLAVAIFFAAVMLSAFEILPIAVSAIAGSMIMLATGCLNIRQAARAIDRKIYFLVGGMLALGLLLQESGAAQAIASGMLAIPYMDVPIVALSAFFFLIMIATNLLSNNACAVLFTPIAVGLAQSLPIPAELGINAVALLAMTVIFASNCSFATPVGYQTNLLVMGPGHYRFRDFIKVGAPLVLIVWITYILVLRFYFGL